MKKINLDQALNVLNSLNTSFFTVEFIKKTTGEKRIMNCMKHVKKHLKNGSLAYSPSDKGLIPVYDIQKQGYRMININGLISIKANKTTYLIN